MIDLYIDKKNTLSFIKSRKHPIFADCETLIKRSINVHFNFAKDDVAKDEILEAWFKSIIMDDIGDTDKHFINSKSSFSIFPSRDLKADCYTDFSKEQLSSIYLLDDNNCVKVKEKGCLLIGEVGEEITVLSKMFIDKTSCQCQNSIAVREMNSWDDIKDFMLPCTDIIFSDPYILQDTSLLNYNLYKLLDLLCSNAREISVNIVVITKKEWKDKAKDNLRYYDNIKMKIKKNIEVVTGTIPNVTFVFPPKEFREHDRIIFTNYKKLTSGDTFSYFKNNGNRRTRGRELIISGFGNPSTYDLAMRFIRDMQTNLENIQTKDKNYLIIGDKQSRYLNF